MILSHDQLETFAKDGLLSLGGGLPDDVWRPLADRVQSDPNVPVAEFKNRRKRVTRALKPHLGAVYTEEIDGCADQLMADNAVGRHAALLLMTLPGQSPMGPVTQWSIPRQAWHTDAPRVGGPGVPGIIALGFLGQVLAGGGGTLFVAGSHRLLDAPGRELRSKAFKKALRRKTYFNVLLGQDSPERVQYLAEAHRVDGVDLRVVELTGEPGDVVLADARLLHAPAPNAQSTPRLMVRGFYIGRPLAEHYSALWPEYRVSSRPDAA